MSFYKTFKTNEKREKEDGICLDYGADGKLFVKRAGGSNQRYSDAVRSRILKPYKRLIDNDEPIDPKLSQEIFAGIYADTILVNWSGVKGEDGQKLEFCRANIIKLFTDIPELFIDVQSQCQKFANFKEAELEEERKNFVTLSPGTTSTQTD